MPVPQRELDLVEVSLASFSTLLRSPILLLSAIAFSIRSCQNFLTNLRLMSSSLLNFVSIVVKDTEIKLEVRNVQVVSSAASGQNLL
jgi:hypothetical protein